MLSVIYLWKHHYCCCVVCEKVIRASKELGVKQKISVVEALDKYCAIPSIEDGDAKFCYNIASLRTDVNRLLQLGANEFRVCKKVKSINPDFCTAKLAKLERTGVQINERFKRGIIYE